MKSSPIKLKQKLSPKASAAKKIRDKKAAMSEDGKYKKRTAQVERGKKSSAFLKGKDYDHRTSSFESVAYNRGGGGNGTKNE